jgi:hypothetical protein
VASVLVLERRFAVCPDTKARLLFALFPVCQLVGCACQIAWRVATTPVPGARDQALRSNRARIGMTTAVFLGGERQERKVQGASQRLMRWMRLR